MNEGYQMTIFDYLSKDEHMWNHFRDNYCSHQSATIRFDSNGHCSNNKDDSFKKGCAFKDENTAHCWDDWQVCNYENCPLIKYLKGGDNNAGHQPERM